jgi:hypothetical protein
MTLHYAYSMLVGFTKLEGGNIIIILLLVKANLEFFPCLNFDFVAPVAMKCLLT